MSFNSLKNNAAVIAAVILCVCTTLPAASPSRVGRDGVVLREGPGNYYKLLAVLDKQSEVTVTDSVRGWFKVNVTGDGSGWISANVFGTAAAPAAVAAKRSAGVDKTAIGAMIRGLKGGLSAGSKALSVNIEGGAVDPASVRQFRSGFNAPELTAAPPLGARAYGLSIYPQLLAIAPVIAATLIEEWGGRNRANEQYANQIVLWITDRIGAGNLTPQVFITNSGENAVCLPGGWIVMGGGLFAQVRDESELAALLAHETAHAIFNHGEKQFNKQSYRIGIKKVFDQLDEETFDPDIDTVDVSDLEQMADDIRAQALRRWAIGDELQADSAAVAWLSLCGYDPTALKRFLVRSRDSMGTRLSGGGNATTTGWMGDTRELDQRIAALDRRMSSLPVSVLRSGNGYSDRFRRTVR